jgi:hypothetical protein
MFTPKQIEDNLDERLLPIQPVVVGLMVVVILIAIWAIVQPNAVIRTGILTWFVLP